MTLFPALLPALCAVLPALISPTRAETRTLHQFGLANWPTGLQYSFEIEERAYLAPDQEAVLWRNNHAAVGAHADLTPAFLRLGPVVKFEPIAVWDVQARLYGTWYFGTFTTLMPLRGPDTAATAAYKRDNIQDRTGALGLRFEANSRFKIKLGPVLAVFEIEARDIFIDPLSGGASAPIRYVWEPTEMLNLPRHSWTLHQNLIVAGALVPEVDNRRLLVGLYGQRQQSLATGDENLRAGPMVWIHPWSSTAIPQIVAASQVWWVSGFTPVWPPYTWMALRWETAT